MKDQKKTYSKIYIRETDEWKTVEVTSELKPPIASKVLEKWQFLLNTLAKITKVSSALIMNLSKEHLEVFMANQSPDNPATAGAKDEVIYGMFCETVMARQESLLVPNALKDPIWKDNNPDVEIGLISYLGFPINWPDGEVFGTVCILDDKENEYNEDYINLMRNVKSSIEKDFELIINQQVLLKKNEELEQANQIKSKFLSLVSHDIRGAVGTLNSFLNLVVNDFEAFEKLKMKDILKNLSRSAEHTYTTLEGLLSWSKNDMLLLEAHKTKVDVCALVRDVVKYYKQTIQVKNIKLSTYFYSDDIKVMFDEKMLETAVRNVLSNAFKYSERYGRVELRVLSKGSKVLIEVEDDGIGMSEEIKSNLFSYNENHAAQGTEGESSAGIGLMLVKEFLDKNGAKIEVESELGEGSVFRIVI